MSGPQTKGLGRVYILRVGLRGDAPKARARIHAFGASRLSILILKINFTCRTHIHWLGDGHITSNNETILAKSPLASNFAKANVELQLLTPIAREQSVTEGGMMLSDD